MTMIAQLLLFSCACALGSSQEELSFGDTAASIAKAYKILTDNVLSMDGNIPLLDDPRRHYAEIIHVIHDEAQHEISCLGHDYSKDYQKNINASAQYALVHPQGVVNETKKVILDITESIKKVAELVQAAVYQSDLVELSKEVEDHTFKPVQNYTKSWNVFLAAGLVATQLNKQHDAYFASHSHNYSANHFVITESGKLYKTVIALKNLYQLMYQRHLQC